MAKRNKAMSKRKDGDKKSEQQGVSRRVFLKTSVGIALVGASIAPFRLLSAENVPPEPDNLDEPTPWQEGDPEPVEMTAPAQEPEQTSKEAPPCQPIDDDRPTQPGPDYVWVMGYWWWTSGTYVWVPGYWAVPPYASYVYVPGYWTYKGGIWVYVRGGWAKPNTTVIVVYPKPRPVLTALVITAPIRIARRHHRWHHHHARRAHHRAAHRRIHRHRTPPKGPAGPSPRPGGPRGPGRRPGPRR